MSCKRGNNIFGKVGGINESFLFLSFFFHVYLFIFSLFIYVLPTPKKKNPQLLPAIPFHRVYPLTVNRPIFRCEIDSLSYEKF